MNIDLSFTQDEKWIEERELHWLPVAKFLKGNFRKIEIANIKKYFMAGLTTETYTNDSGKFSYFPLQTPVGWDYVLQNKIEQQSEFRNLFNETLQDRSNIDLFPDMAPYELARWDYFLGDTFEATITSRVPIAGKRVSLELDPYDVFCRVAPGFTGFLEYDNRSGEWPKWIQRSDYFWSLWPVFRDADFNSDSRTIAKAIRFITRMFKFISGESSYEFDDPNKTRPKFLKIMEEKLDELYPQLCPRLQLLWDRAKAKRSAIN
jgi:hypothetical protein